MKRASPLKTAAFMLAASAAIAAYTAPSAAQESRYPYYDRMSARDELSELLGERYGGDKSDRRREVIDLILDRMAQRGELRDLILDRMERRRALRELILNRLAEEEGYGAERTYGRGASADRSALAEAILSRIAARAELRDLILEKLARRAALRDRLFERLEERGGLRALLADLREARGETGGRYEEEGMNREDLRDLILDRVRSHGDAVRLLDLIRDRTGGNG